MKRDQRKEEYMRYIDKHILDRLTSIDNLLGILIKISKEQLEVLRLLAGMRRIKEEKEEKEIVVVTKHVLNDKYDIIELDLSKERIDEPIGLREKGLVVNYMTVLQCDGEAYVKLNSRAHKPIPVSTGFEVSDFEINEIFVTNPSQTGKLVIYIEWR